MTVMKSPSVGGGDPPIAIFPFLGTVMTLDYFQMHK